MKYAVHKLLIAQRRKPHDPKKQKDLMQARELLDNLIETDQALRPKKPLGADAPKATRDAGHVQDREALDPTAEVNDLPPKPKRTHGRT